MKNTVISVCLSTNNMRVGHQGMRHQLNLIDTACSIHIIMYNIGCN